MQVWINSQHGSNYQYKFKWQCIPKINITAGVTHSGLSDKQGVLYVDGRRLVKYHLTCLKTFSSGPPEGLSPMCTNWWHLCIQYHEHLCDLMHFNKAWTTFVNWMLLWGIHSTLWCIIKAIQHRIQRRTQDVRGTGARKNKKGTSCMPLGTRAQKSRDTFIVKRGRVTVICPLEGHPRSHPARQCHKGSWSSEFKTKEQYT